MTTLKTIVVTKKPAPKSEPTAREIPYSKPPAENDEITSGAPFAKAKIVTPASVSLMLNLFFILVRLGVK